MNTCCLNLILACIVYWHASEISRVPQPVRSGRQWNRCSLLERVSPIEWGNVVLYGQYILNRKLVRQRRQLL
jgi:Tn3 transposase DDE domain-containing protein